MRHLKPREVKGFAQHHTAIWQPGWGHDPSLWTPVSVSESAEEVLPRAASALPTLTPARGGEATVGICGSDSCVPGHLTTREPAVCDHPAHPPHALGQGGPGLTLPVTGSASLPHSLTPSYSWSGVGTGTTQGQLGFPLPVWPSPFPS